MQHAWLACLIRLADQHLKNVEGKLADLMPPAAISALVAVCLGWAAWLVTGAKAEA